jgi:hypothetical protein
MAVTKADVILIAPELSALDDATFNAFLADGQKLHSQAAWGAKYDMALKWWLAHWLVSSGFGSGAGAHGSVSSMTVGGVTVSYATSAAKGAASDYSTTRYGRFYLTLLRQLALHVAVV